MNELFEIRDLTIELSQDGSNIPVVQDVSIKVMPGQAVGIVGESGSGKSLTAASILRLLPKPILNKTKGSFYFKGECLDSWDSKKFRNDFRWRKASMIFQDSSSSFNPVITIGKHFEESLAKLNKPKSAAEGLLHEVGLHEVERVWASYPHQLSGGMKQRVSIAIALAASPELLIADEPTTASDAVVQLQILKTLKKLQQSHSMAVVLVTHDINMLKYFCEYIYVIYCGRIVEQGLTSEILARPRHPYTSGLIKSNISVETEYGKELPVIPGAVPEIGSWHKACSFYDRCERRSEKCSAQIPVMKDGAACFHPLI